MKQKIVFLILFALVLTFTKQVSGYSSSSPNISSEELLKIIQVMNGNDIEVNAWSLYSKEHWGNMNEEALQARLHQLKNKLNHTAIHWETEKTEEVWKAVGSIENQSSINEQFVLVAHHKNDKYDTYFLYKVNGKKWDNKIWSAFVPTLQQRISNVFQEKPENFACVRGEQSDNIEGVLYNRAVFLLNQFDAKEIESLNEESFVSLSAYNGKWKNDIPAKNGAMNLQVALRRGLGGKTTVTIGTPIITSEY